MSIVAISQTLGSLGDEIGHELVRTIGYEFADREIILKAAEQFGEGVTEPAHVTVEQQQGLTPDGAAHVVRDSDRERSSRVRFLYHADWDDPLLYDLVLNTERLDVGLAARLIQEMLLTERVQPTSDSLTEVKDLSLIAQAKAALAAHPMTRALQLSVDCKSGHLTISGMVEREDWREAVEEIVRKVPGVSSVVSQIMVSRRQYHPGV